MKQPNYQNTEEVEHQFVLHKDSLGAIMEWISRNDPQREVTEYVYGWFAAPDAEAIRKFRGIRLYVSDISMALMFAIEFSEGIHPGYIRKNDLIYNFGTRL